MLTPRHPPRAQGSAAPTPAGYPAPQGLPQAYVNPDADMANTTVFVGGLDPSVGEVELRQAFAPFGEPPFERPLAQPAALHPSKG